MPHFSNWGLYVMLQKTTLMSLCSSYRLEIIPSDVNMAISAEQGFLKSQIVALVVKRCRQVQEATSCSSTS